MKMSIEDLPKFMNNSFHYYFWILHKQVTFNSNFVISDKQNAEHVT